MHVFPAEQRELISMEGRSHSSLTTPNHRWPVELWREKVKGRQNFREWRTTETLQFNDRIPVAAMCADLAEEPKYSDAFVELVAWYWTEGDGGMKRGPRITQSLHHEENVARIDASLRKVFGSPTTLKYGPNSEPAWTRRETDGRLARFVLNKAAASEVFEVAPDRIVKWDFLRALTQAQLELFIDVSMLADGHEGATSSLGQRSKERAESFQFACVLAGRTTSLRYYPRADMWKVTLRTPRHLHPKAAQRGANAENGFKITRLTHNGIVWCPKTANRTWLASRNGSVYFTGNTISVSEECSTFSDITDRGARVRRLMSSMEETLIAHELWTGDLASGAFLSDGVTPWPNSWLAKFGDYDDLSETGPVAHVHALACLQQYLADNNGGQQGMIHATSQTITHWESFRLLRREGNRILTMQDNIVVPSPGYPGTDHQGNISDGNIWAFATDIVRVWLGPVQTYDRDDMIDRRNNTIVAVASRMALAEWQRCRHAGIQLDQQVCAAGGS